MEGTPDKRSAQKPDPEARNRLIVEYWAALGRPGVGAQVLSTIQAELSRRLGKTGIASPAAIARVLADQGAELRHPEVIECDAGWRAERIQVEAKQLSEAGLPAPGEALTLKQAEVLMARLEELRTGSGATDAQRIRSMAIEARETAQRYARRKTLTENQRAEQKEIAEWLGVWIKTPKLFKDWLELRQRSPGYRRKFG